MNKSVRLVASFLIVLPSMAAAQITASGQTAVDWYQSGRTTSQRSVNNGRPSFGFESDLFLDGRVNDNVAGMMNVRVLDNGSLYFDYVAIRLSHLTSLDLNIQAGKFFLPFGDLGDRRYPRQNPLFGLPVTYEYRTDLSSYVPTEGEIRYGSGSGAGMRLLDGGLYDIGVMVYGSFGIFDYAFAVTNGTISETEYKSGNTNSDFGKIVRLAVTPFTGLTFGGAYAWGAYLVDQTVSFPRAIDVNSYDQEAAEADVEFSRGHFVFLGEGVYSTWKVPFETRDQNLKTLGFSLEGKYTIIPRLFVALRLSGLHFGTAVLEGASEPWDYDVTEGEGGLGYFLDRDVLLKIVRRETRIHGGSFPKDHLTALQLVVAY